MVQYLKLIEQLFCHGLEEFRLWRAIHEKVFQKNANFETQWISNTFPRKILFGNFDPPLISNHQNLVKLLSEWDDIAARTIWEFCDIWILIFF